MARQLIRSGRRAVSSVAVFSMAPALPASHSSTTPLFSLSQRIELTSLALDMPIFFSNQNRTRIASRVLCYSLRSW